MKLWVSTQGCKPTQKRLIHLRENLGYGACSTRVIVDDITDDKDEGGREVVDLHSKVRCVEALAWMIARHMRTVLTICSRKSRVMCVYADEKWISDTTTISTPSYGDVHDDAVHKTMSQQ